MKVLVTGATGYIGHQLAQSLAKKGITVHALCRNINSAKVPDHENIVLFEGDICDSSAINKAIEACEYVFHTAAYTNLKCRNIHKFYQTNVVGTENLLEASLKYNIKKFIYTSSLSVFGPSYKDVSITEKQPRLAAYGNDYELTKSMSEEKILAYSKQGLPYIILNVTKVYGPGFKTFSSGVNKLIELIAKKDMLVVPDRMEVTANYVYVEDVVNAHIQAMESNIISGKYIIGGDNLSYKQLFQNIKKHTKSSIKIITINYQLLRSGLFFWDALRTVFGLPSSLTPAVLDALFVNRKSVSCLAKRELNYSPVSFEHGLQQTIKKLNLIS
ncbi:SDR family NAD(P)-dependent oxidoreductase [Aestuariibaculum sediminum]|uniref:SDR family NAD(P)-dependent oxidoreductase n=1 Tax=Aestuariibaculum sediminum TaxID=2770637 RepID=A0A8J6Q7A7_9FLAO|nr:SDR family NAD(P)-dependent oxidoreductase [Aestuariibaculum sediminum]MBD0832458.1 SDR family NAD(P)-dependent oxidoreductase [Aestuariibaculum sediminum]